MRPKVRGLSRCAERPRSETIVAVVIAPDPARIVLEIERGGRTIHGRVAVDGGPVSGFHGWLELIDELERACTHSSGRTAAEQGSEPVKGVRVLYAPLLALATLAGACAACRAAPAVAAAGAGSPASTSFAWARTPHAYAARGRGLSFWVGPDGTIVRRRRTSWQIRLRAVGRAGGVSVELSPARPRMRSSTTLAAGRGPLRRMVGQRPSGSRARLDRQQPDRR